MNSTNEISSSEQALDLLASWTATPDAPDLAGLRDQAGHRFA